ncbi:MAG: sigma-E factor negative regulatory protein [Anaerolineae bacterium]|nr:sigma-E factor negative regulatory protein [Anaerolineae bacterium]MCI0608756.1 sigma-E factor negative regulatory protein [Anaerolineae bacterium]
MDNLLTPNEQDSFIEDALRSYPLAKIPKDITESVMARIRNEPAPRFQITRTDYLLAIVLTLVLGGIILGFQFLPPIVLLQMQIQGILLWQSLLVNYRWLLPMTSIILGTFLAGIAFYQLLRYQRS